MTNRKWFKNCRKQKQLTIQQISKAVGLSESYICLIEHNKRTPSPHIAKKLGILLNFDWRRFYEDNMQDEKNEVEALCEVNR